MPANSDKRNEIVGVILAGGASRRMGGRDKAFALLDGRPLVRHVIDRLGPQVGRLAVNANGDPARFAAFGLPVIADAGAERAGPLAGILAGMTWAAALPAARWISAVPADTPFVPRDMVARLAAGIGGATVAIARSRGEIHPVVGLFALTLRDDLSAWLATTSDRSARTWVARHSAVAVDFPLGPNGMDPFFNVNTPEDLARAEDGARTPAASPPVVHVVFNMSPAGSLRRALDEVGVREAVVGSPDDLSSGPINPVTAETRETWLGEGLGYFDPDNRYRRELESFWTEATRPDAFAVVWVNRRSAQEHAGFLEFVWRMGKRRYDIVDMTDVVFHYRPGVSGPAQAFGQLNHNQIIEAGLLDLRRPLTAVQRNSYRQEWAHLREENAPIRIVTPEGMRSAPITYFDEMLLSFVPDQWVPGALVLGKALAAQSDGPYFQTGDLLLFSRLRALVDAGLIEGRGDLTMLRSSFVRSRSPAG